MEYKKECPFKMTVECFPNKRMEPVKTIRIFLAVAAVNLLTFSAGTTSGWTSPVLPKLKSLDTSDSPLSHPIGSTYDGLISSFIAVGAILAPFFAGFLADKIGRKWSLLSNSICFIIGFVLMLVANKVWIILLGRVFHGFGVGFIFTVQPMYVGEVSTDNIRGAMGSIMQLFLVCGILYAYAIGPFVSYIALQYFCLAIPIVFVLVFIFMPESPYYYAAKGKDDEALKSLQFLRGQSATVVQDELEKIKKNIEESLSHKGTIGEIFRVPGNRKAFFISLGIITFQHLSGINALMFNAQTIFQSSHIDLDPALASIVVAAVQVIASSSTPTFADRFGRKVILLTSLNIMTVVLLTLGGFFYMQLVVGDASYISWLPLPALIIYNIVYYAGFGPIPWAILSEMFSTNIKSKALALVSSTSSIIGFLVAFSFPILNDVGAYYSFWMFAGFCVIGSVFIIFIVIETKGLSFQEIQDKLNTKKN